MKLTRSITFDPTRDARLLAWLDSKPAGFAPVVRDILYAAYRAEQSDGNGNNAGVGGGTSPIEPGQLYRMLDQVLTDLLDLSAIRQVVEAGVASAMAGAGAVTVSRSNGQLPLADAVDWLDTLNANLVIE